MYPGVSVRPRLYKPAPGLLRGIVSVRQNVFLFWRVEHIRIFFKTRSLFPSSYGGTHSAVRKRVEEKMGTDLSRLMTRAFCNGGELVWGEPAMGRNLLSVMKTVHRAQYGKTIAGLLSTLHHFLVRRLLSNTRCLLIFVKPRSLLSSRLQLITHLANIHCCALLLFIVVIIARILWFINNAYLTLVFVLFYIISLESIGLMKREKKNMHEGVNYLICFQANNIW